VPVTIDKFWKPYDLDGGPRNPPGGKHGKPNRLRSTSGALAA
jgi:hypothetical protein